MKDLHIAFFTADWNYELVESTLHGVKQFTEDHNNVHICVFDCFGKDQNSSRDQSEYGIFRLPDLSLFDGLLIQGSQIVLEQIREEIAQRVTEYGIPALSVDCPIPGCSLTTIDGEQAEYDITDHLIRHHGARRLVYLTGLMDNGCPEAAQRMDGFLTSCRENGVEFEVIKCTWRTSDGEEVARRWLKENRPLPDAFVCGNDEMALGLSEVLIDHGLHIPEDVMVTGFDDVTSAQLARPRLSTVRRDYKKMNYQALSNLLELIESGTVGMQNRKFMFDYELVFSESCGCKVPSQSGALRDKYFQQTRFLKNFYTVQDRMAEALFEASDLPELMRIVEQNSYVFGCDNVWLCVNDYYYDNYDKKQWKHDSRSFGENMVLHVENEELRFPRADLLPQDLKHDAHFLVFYPLHYSSYNIGYVVMDGISEAAKLNLHESIFSFLEIAIENVRKKCLLRQFNQVLDNLYVHDALTGIYNRFGLSRYGKETFDSYLQHDNGALILFIDMDSMKEINDFYGHEKGDLAIIATANALSEAVAPDDFLMRYGGDEFLIIASPKDISLRERIDQALLRFNSSTNEPFHLSLSIGTVYADAAESPTLETCVKEADAQMYKRKKESRR